jgi:hypothetical protein
MRRLATHAATAFALTVLAAAANAETSVDTGPTCQILGLRPDAVLEQCGDKVRSISLAMRDIARVVSIDGSSGAMVFVCPVQQICSGEPVISGWLVDPRRWTKSARDEDTLFALLLTPPAVIARRGRNPWTDQPHPTASCPMFDIQIAGLSGRAVCYVAENQKSAGLFAVVANDEVGFVMAFRSDELDTPGLREKVLTILPRFQIEVATGDHGLLRWIR